MRRQVALASSPADGAGPGPRALPSSFSGCDDVSGITIWGADRGTELELREMGGAFPFSCRKPPWCLQKHGMSPHCLGQGWLLGLVLFS